MKEKTLEPRAGVSVEPISIELSQPAPVVHVTVVQPRPLLVSDRTAEQVLGLSVRAWRKISRAMADAGLSVTRTSDGVVAAVADVEKWLAESAPRLPAEAQPATPARGDDDALLLASAGVRLSA